jgi:hypothetical protein
MKTLSTTLLILVFTITLNAQANLEVTKNMKYLQDVTSEGKSAKIKKFQKMAAYFNIEKTEGYDSNEASTYDVVFEETNCKIKAIFNSEGQIINSIEVYDDMRMPITLTKQILTDNDKWLIVNNTQKLYYNNNTGVDRVYEVKMRKDNKTKVLKFKYDNQNSTKNYVALN